MPILGIYASQISGHLYAGPYGAYDALASVTLSSTTSEINFVGIPSTYKHLQVRSFTCSNRGTYGGVNMQLRLNSDTSNYSGHTMSGDGGGSAATYNTNPTSDFWVGDAGSTVINQFGVAIIDLLDYANTTKYKTIRSLAGLDTNGLIAGYGGSVGLWSANWRSTSAINSLSFTLGGSLSFVSGTKISLYGVK